jgi:hypothetical protein
VTSPGRAADRTTQRVVVLMTAGEKKRLERRAAAAKISVGEFARRSIQSYRPENADDETAIHELLAAVQNSNKEALRALDEAEAELKATRDYFASKPGSAGGGEV